MMFVLLVKASPLFMVKVNRKILRAIGWRLTKRHRGIIGKNLDIAFPDAPKDEKEQLVHSIYNHFARVLVENIYLFAKLKPEKLFKSIEVRNLEVLENALKKDKGAILFSAHFGNWELVPYILSRRLNTQLVSIAREMNNPLVEKVVLRFRERMGSTVIYKKNSLRSMLKMLDRNRVVFLLIDQNTIEREGVYVRFFGEEVSAVPTVSQLHLRKEKPAVPLFLHYDYENDKIVLELLDEIRFSGTGDLQEDIRALTQQCTGLIEENIKKHPEQWFWFHNRWKTRRGAPSDNKTQS